MFCKSQEVLKIYILNILFSFSSDTTVKPYNYTVKLKLNSWIMDPVFFHCSYVASIKISRF